MTRCAGLGWMVLVVIAASAPVRAAIHVDHNANQTPHDGSDWCHAYLELYQALAVAGPGTTIKVADGTYLPDVTGLGNPREARFNVPGGVTIQGGFGGCGGGGDERDIVLYPTLLSGDIAGSNCYHVVALAYAATNVVLDGLTITAGDAVGSGTPAMGGGMYIGNSNTATLVDCTFFDNAAQYGGGFFNNQGHATLTRCKFKQNETTASAGGMYDIGTGSQATAVLTDCVFEGNSAGTGGGGLRCYDSSPTLTGCVFEGNYARTHGAAVSAGGAGTPTFTRCIFKSNRVDTLFGNWDSFGAGTYHSDTSVSTFVNCVFFQNRGIAMLPYLSRGGALSTTGSSEVVLRNCTLAGNSAYVGNGFYANGQSNVDVINSIMWDAGGELAIDGSATASFAYSDVNGLFGGIGCMNENPHLDGWEIQADSPCINGGDPAFVPPPGETDINGDPRVLFGCVDMGADEANEFADCNSNGVPDGRDILLGTSLDLNGNDIPDECELPPVCRGDCNCDGAVGFTDIDLFVAAIPANEANWRSKFELYYGVQPPAGCWENCDVNGVGTHAGFDDIDPFVALIPSACPR